MMKNSEFSVIVGRGEIRRKKEEEEEKKAITDKISVYLLLNRIKLPSIILLLSN